MKKLMESIERARVESGDQQRASGRTSRMVLNVITHASEGKKIRVRVDNVNYVHDIKHKFCRVMEALIGVESFHVDGDKITMIGGGVICIESRNSPKRWMNVKFTMVTGDHYDSKRGC